jgi:hypothetical protein
VSTDAVVSAHILRLIREDWGNRSRDRFILRNLPYFSGMTEKITKTSGKQIFVLRLEPETFVIQFGVLCFIRMRIKIPVTQEYDDTAASEDKRLVRGLEIRGSECYSET